MTSEVSQAFCFLLSQNDAFLVVPSPKYEAVRKPGTDVLGSLLFRKLCANSCTLEVARVVNSSASIEGMC